MRRPRRSHRRAPRLLSLLLAAAALLAAALAVAAEPKDEPDLAATGARAEPAAPGGKGRADAVARGRTAGRGSDPRRVASRPHDVEWRRSVALGQPSAGSLLRGVMLPAGGRNWVSWDPVEREKPNRWWRRWGTDRLLRTTLTVVRGYAAAHPGAPRILVGDLSRPRGGDFGTRFGPIGHASHQNGLDIDIYYPRLDRRETPPLQPGQVDTKLAQELVDRFVAAGAERVFVGPSLPLTGPPEVVVPLVNHDNHLHVRLPGA